MKARKSIKFTHKALHKLETPAKGKRGVYFDTEVKNLNIIITDTGSKYFYVRKVIDGRSRRVRLGAFSDLSVENARNKAMEIKSAIAKGEDPYEVHQRRKSEPTFTEFFEEYMQRHSIPHKKPASRQNDLSNFNCYLRDSLGNRKLSSISRTDIERLHRSIGEDAPYAANRVLGLVKAMYTKAREWKQMEGENPAANIVLFKEKSRERFLQGDEFPRLFAALDEEPNADIRDYVLLSLYTGARQGNILSMCWNALDFDRGIWRIEETKNGQPQNVPLVPPALDVLQHRKKKAERGAIFVFPSTGKTGHMVEPKSGWKRILKRAEIKDLRLHDLRRTMGSYQAINGTSLHIIGKSLGHKSLTATQIYSRLTDDPVRESMNRATEMMLALGKESNNANNS